MQQTNGSNFSSNKPGRRIILIISVALATLVILVAGGLAYFFTLTHADNQPCTAASPYGFTTINADAQLVKVYKQLNVCWVRYQYHGKQQGKKPGIETDPELGTR